MREKECQLRILLKWRGNQNILILRKTKRLCHQQTYSKRIAKGNSLNRKETIKKENLNHQEGGKNTESKNTGQYNRISSSSWFF